jgi:hypothetical protein
MSTCKNCNPLNCAPDLCGARWDQTCNTDPVELWNNSADAPAASTGKPPWPLQAGDIITFAGVYVKPKWWQFWRWGEKPPELKQFVVTWAETENPEL